ncbi:MAG: transcriptional repressor [Isosphaeraceae bacterium]
MIRKTRQREAILRALREQGRPLSPAEIQESAAREIEGLGMATVYRAIRALVEEGVAVAVELPGEPARYESREAAVHHHHHFRCDDCGRVFDIPGCPRGVENLTPEGFRTVGHELLLFGQCRDCAAD